MHSSLAAFRYELCIGPLKIDRTLALASTGAGSSFIPARLRTPAVKLAQVADMEFFRTYGLLWSLWSRE